MSAFLSPLNQTCFEVLGYPMSYLELFGTLTGLLTVWLAAKANLLTWPTGLLNNVAFFVIFYQVQLYADMFLQVYFFVISLYGWWNWRRNRGQPDKNVTVLTTRQRIGLAALAFLSVVTLGFSVSKIHSYFPGYFSQPAAYPYADAFTAVLSIVATGVMAHKKLECWVLWILVDAVSIVLYATKGIHLIALEYAVFLVICAAGLLKWTKLYANRSGPRQVYAPPRGTP